MTDSTQGVSEAKKREKLEKLRKNRKSRKDYTEARDLPTWAKMALARCEMLGLSRKEVASDVGRSPQTLTKYAQTPAGKAWVAEIRKQAADEEKVTEWITKAQETGQLLEFMTLADIARARGDLVLEERIRSKVLVSTGALKAGKKDHDDRPVIMINLPGYTGKEPPVLEAVEVESDHRLLTDGE